MGRHRLLRLPSPHELVLAAVLLGAAAQTTHALGDCALAALACDDDQLGAAAVRLLQINSALAGRAPTATTATGTTTTTIGPGPRAAASANDTTAISRRPPANVSTFGDSFLGEITREWMSPRVGWMVTGLVLVILVLGLVGACIARWTQGKDDFGFARYHRALHNLVVLMSLLFGVCFLLIFLNYFSGWLLQSLIERFSLGFLGVQVSLQKLQVSPFRGSIDATNLTIGNWPGYSSEPMASVDSLYFEVDLWTLIFTMALRIPIDEIVVRGVNVVYEQGFPNSNIMDLVNSFGPSGGRRKIVVGRVDIKNITAHAAIRYMYVSSGVDLPVDDIEYADFARETGAIYSTDIVHEIVGKVLTSVEKVFER